MGRDIQAWIDYDEDWSREPGSSDLRAWTFAELSFDRDSLLFDLLAGAGRSTTLESAIEAARRHDIKAFHRHIRGRPALVTLKPKGLPTRLGGGPKRTLLEIGFVQPEGSTLSHLLGTPRDDDAYRFKERPVYTWPPVDPAYSGFSWLSAGELSEVAERYVAVPWVWPSGVIYGRRNAQLDATIAAMTVLDRQGFESRFVFWFED